MKLQANGMQMKKKLNTIFWAKRVKISLCFAMHLRQNLLFSLVLTESQKVWS